MEVGTKVYRIDRSAPSNGLLMTLLRRLCRCLSRNNKYILLLNLNQKQESNEIPVGEAFQSHCCHVYENLPFSHVQILNPLMFQSLTILVLNQSRTSFHLGLILSHCSLTLNLRIPTLHHQWQRSRRYQQLWSVRSAQLYMLSSPQPLKIERKAGEHK